jgi:hypothetical protein
MEQPFQVGLPRARVEVKIVLAIALRDSLRKSSVCGEDEQQGE